MLDSKENGQSGSPCCSSECEEPSRIRRGPCNRGRFLRGGRWSKPAGADVFDGPRGGGDTLHVYPGGTGGYDRQMLRGSVGRRKLSPTRNDLGTHTKIVAEPLSCRQHIVRGLSVDVQHLRKSQNQVGLLFWIHDRFSMIPTTRTSESG